jgi:pyruvate/2-oxoglutarate/acetoin dehydrogenase E1 component
MLEQEKEYNFNFMKYFDELKKAMSMLAEHPDTLFLGQSIEYEGTGLYDSLSHIPSNKKIELPVAEYLQAGLANGMAIEGIIPISTYPRWNFLLMATDQIVNHSDKIKEMSNSKSLPKLIIRVAVGGERPIDPQCQHKGNFSEAFRLMTNNTEIIELNEPEDILPAYQKALNRNDGIITILVEFSDFSREK